MFDRGFLWLFRLVRRHRLPVLLLVAVITAASVAALSLIHYDSNINTMLPPEKEVVQSMEFLKESNLSDKVVLSFTLTDPAKSKSDLFAAVDQLAARLTPPLFTKVTTGVSVSGVMEQFSVLEYGPQVLGEEELARIDSQLTPDAVVHRMQEVYKQSLRPESVFTASMARTDPLGINSLLMAKMKALPSSMSYDVQVDNGHFVSRDGRHALMIVQTPVQMMDAARSRVLIDTLKAELKTLPPYVSADIISGHLHTVSNERMIKRDIAVASIISTIAFLVLFLVVFRDVRVLGVFFIPIIAVVWSIVAAAGIEGTLSYLVIGFGSAIAGISSDYGLHVYVALKHGADEAKMAKLARLLTIDAATTMLSFGVLFFSLINGYHQLALFSILCVFICLMLSVFVLPLMLFGKAMPEPTPSKVDYHLMSIRLPARLSVGVWLVLTGIALWFSFSARLDNDLKKFDGSGPDIVQAEKNFHAVWGGKENQAIFVVSGTSLEEAMEKNDRVFREARRIVPGDDFTSLAMFWPSPKTRQENRERWDRFWADGREKKLKSLLRGAAPAYGFSEEAFTPFFDGLYSSGSNASPSGVMAQFQERFVIQRDGGWSVLSFFPDSQEYVDGLKRVADRVPGSFIVSGTRISTVVGDFTARESCLLAPLAVLVNVVLAWMFFRNWRETFISLVPIVTGIAWFVGIMSMMGIAINAVNIVAAIVSTGVIVDYGIGVTYEHRYNLRIGTAIAITLSAATNVIGSGALLFARYPALYSTGIALVICMLAGYLAALLVVPSLCDLLWPEGRGERA